MFGLMFDKMFGLVFDPQDIHYEMWQRLIVHVWHAWHMWHAWRVWYFWHVLYVWHDDHPTMCAFQIPDTRQDFEHVPRSVSVREWP